jgi:type IV pilus assembly protein PilO
MPGRFSVNRLLPAAALPAGWKKEPRLVARALLGVLLAANVVGAFFLVRPPGGSPEELSRRLAQLGSQIRQRETSVERLRKIVEKSEKARTEGEAFLRQYFMDRRTASSTIVTELKEAATRAGIRQQEHTFAYEPIEGSEDLSMLTVSGNYEGAYGDIVKFVNHLDRSPRFLLLDTLTAAPERAAGVLRVNLKMNAFVLDRGSGPPAAPDEGETADETASEEAAP